MTPLDSFCILFPELHPPYLSVIVFGISSTNSTIRGYLYGAVVFFHMVLEFFFKFFGRLVALAQHDGGFYYLAPVLMRNAVIAVSKTAGCSMSALSTSKGPIL